MEHFDHSKLRGRMAELGYTIKSLAKEVGMHKNTLSRKLLCEMYFTTSEIYRIVQVLGIPIESIYMYFFMTQNY